MKNQLVVVFTSWLLNTCVAYDVHKHMTLEEIKSVFHVDHHDLVPHYEIVPIEHINKRSIATSLNLTQNSIHDKSSHEKITKTSSNKFLPPIKTHLNLKAFGKPFNLSLVPTSGLFKKGKLRIWTVEPNATAQHGVEYVEIPEDKEDIGELYQDEENQAAFLIRHENDFVVVEGSIGSDIVIKPVPPRLRNTVKVYFNDTDEESSPIYDDEMFLDSDGDLSSDVAIDTGLPINRQKLSKHHHIVYKRKNQPSEDTFSDYAFMEPDHLSKRQRRSTKKRSKREAPYTIYPEILCIVDYDGYRLHGGDNLQIRRYFVSFWNGVDLRYKLLKGPKIRISIAGIIISRGRDATPYLERNKVGRDAIDSAAALTDMGKYLFRERRLPVYDIAVAITKLDMCRRSYGEGCNRGTAGFAYVGGACVVNKRLEKVNSVAIIEDTGGFSGIIVAAHEVGHLLGAVHDGSPPPSYLGGPGAQKCQWTDGYIMSDLRHTERGFRWSACSVSSFHHFLNGDTATCLYNVPHEDDSLPRVLPGKLLSLDAQCRRDRGTSACFKDDRVCAQLFCFDAQSGYCVAYRPAAEGSPCGDGQYCLNGKCVAEHENIIPDYSENTPPPFFRGNGNAIHRPLFYDEEEENSQNGEIPNNYYNNDYNTQPPQYYNDFNTQPPQYYSEYTTQAPQYNIEDLSSGSPPANQFYQFNDNNYVSNPQVFSGDYFASTNHLIYDMSKRSTNKPEPNNYSTLKPFSFSISTTKSPYDFRHFQNSFIHQTQKPIIIPDPHVKRIHSYLEAVKSTTKSPYDFSDFGKTSKTIYSLNYNQDVNNNYLKRSYEDASYFGDSNRVNNFTAFNTFSFSG